MSANWRWAGARSIGTSHLKSRTPCQDYACTKEFVTPDGPVLAAVVSDGAGSAARAEVGSKTVCISFLRVCEDFFRTSSLSMFDEDIAWDWIDFIREVINVKAQTTGARPRDFAATLVALLISSERTIVLHIGDGAAAIKCARSDGWEVPSWPFQGEYASTTSFITDDPSPRLQVITIDDRVDEFAIFSDGIERMVLDHVVKVPHDPFFNRMTGPLKASALVGEDRQLSSALRSYLDGPAVCERTDDDKSLILGVRL